MGWLCRNLLAAALTIALYLPQGWAAEALSPEQRSEVEAIIEEYLLAHPELLVKVMQKLEAQRQEKEESEQRQRIAQNQTEIFQSKYDHVENPDGRIPLVEFFDYQCGYCKRVYPDLMRVRQQEGDVRMIFKEFPILGPASTYAARAAIAAKRQNKYMAFHDALMSHRGGLDQNVVMSLAETVGLDIERLKQDMERPEVTAEIEANHTLAARLGVRGTPSMFIGDNFVPGAIVYRQMQAMLEQLREDCAVC